MAISNYSELQSAVADWLHRADLTSIIPDLIRVAELRIFREIRCRDMESALSIALSSGVAAVPADYLEIKSAYIDTSPVRQLMRSTVEQIYEKYPTRSAEGIPQLIARENDSFIFGPYPDGDYTLKGVYYAKPTSIQSLANDLFVNNPDLYLFAALCEAAPYIENDPRIPVWEAKYANIKAQLGYEDKVEALSGGGLVVRAA